MINSLFLVNYLLVIFSLSVHQIRFFFFFTLNVLSLFLLFLFIKLLCNSMGHANCTIEKEIFSSKLFLCTVIAMQFVRLFLS